jgi:hypothetical protein
VDAAPQALMIVNGLRAPGEFLNASGNQIPPPQLKTSGLAVTKVSYPV